MDIVPSIEYFDKLREQKAKTTLDLAFQAIFFNRTTFSGILDAGPIGGKNQTGDYKVDCRYNYTRLTKQIQACNRLLKGRTYVQNRDFREYLPVFDSSIALFLDPPYYIKGNGLYAKGMSGQAHMDLNKLVNTRQHWLLTIDDCEFIRSLYTSCKIDVIDAKYLINSKPKFKLELFITPRNTDD
jgi:DNA adenine methylase